MTKCALRWKSFYQNRGLNRGFTLKTQVQNLNLLIHSKWQFHISVQTPARKNLKGSKQQNSTNNACLFNAIIHHHPHHEHCSLCCIFSSSLSLVHHKNIFFSPLVSIIIVASPENNFHNFICNNVVFNAWFVLWAENWRVWRIAGIFKRN